MVNAQPGTRLRNGCTSLVAVLTSFRVGVFVVVLCVVALHACAAVGGEDPGVRSSPVSREAGPTVADEPVPLYEVVRRPGYSFVDHGGVILRIWPSGRIVWSEDPLRGGLPYAEGVLDAQALEDVLAELEPCIVRASSRGYVIVDGGSIVSTLRLGEGHVAQTSHVTFEVNERLVAEEGGVRALSPGETRAEVRARQSEAFRKMVDGWDCLLDVHARAVAAATDVVPLDQDGLERAMRPR